MGRMKTEILYDIPLWVILCSLLLSFPLIAFIGYRFGLQVRERGGPSEDSSGFVPSTVLGLLALILGFTLSMSVSRFDDRKRLVLKESNSIGTTFLRADILEEPFRTQVKENLRRYVSARIQLYDAGVDKEKIAKVLKHTDDLQKLLWSDVVQITKKDQRTVINLFVSEMNDMIDVSAERMFAADNHVPELVYLIIIIVTALGLASIGYMEGVSGKRMYYGVALLSLLFSVVIVLILDLDRPRSGFIVVDQKSLRQLQESMEK